MDRTDTSAARRFQRNTPAAPEVSGGSSRADLRCGCHKLLARAVDDGIELRCVRCKTNTVLRWDLVHRLEADAKAARSFAKAGGAAMLSAPCAKVGDRG